tara:strand:- start:177 stop:977 length:801 start_codon:yes stop_codon:yes gene_type:complete
MLCFPYKFDVNIDSHYSPKLWEFYVKRMKTLLKSESDTERFAIYFAPEIDSNLHSIGSQWLGRDSSSGKSIKQPNIKGISSNYFYSVTKTPRRYGFHATLKAPFRLNKEFTLKDLCSQIQVLSAVSKPFSINLKVQELGNFIALMMDPNEQKMEKLASKLVENLDIFRAPLHQEEIDKRRMSTLTTSEDENLLNWGYPYVFDDFHFHITLTEQIQCGSDRESMKSAASSHFSESLENTIKVSSISLFVQESSEADFLQIQKFALQE